MSLGDLFTLLAVPPATAWIGCRLIGFYRSAGVLKANYRGNAVSPALGPAVLLGYLSGAAATVWLDGAGVLSISVTALLTGFAFLGLWDDLITESASGFKGHFGAGRQGRLTAGLLKVIAAVLFGLIFTGGLPFPLWRRLLALLLILLSANGLNLLDRRPGRTLKAFFLGAILMLFIARPGGGAARLLLPLMAGSLAIAPFDLSAAGMLGDCGANQLGAALGITAVLYLSLPLQAALLLFWGGVHLFCEYFSLSRVIEANSILRRLDGLGRFREKYP